MHSFIKSAMLVAVGVITAIGNTALPSRAADESKSLLERIDKLEKVGGNKDLKKQVKKLQKKLKYMHVENGEINGVAGPHVIFELCNVHIRSGSGSTSDGTVNLATLTEEPGFNPAGWGNLIIGYDEQPIVGGPADRSGSNNLVVGPGHNFPGVGGVLFGQANSVEGPFGTVTGGYNNEATGYTTSVSGGTGNTASQYYASVTGGNLNVASGYYSSVSGGSGNEASVAWSSVSGGGNNTASGEYSSVSGGAGNFASGEYSTVSGGEGNEASAFYSSVSGGFDNIASGITSNVSGGSFRTASGTDDWAAGALFQDE